MLVSDLVNEALYLSVLDRDSDPAPTSSQEHQGLHALQEVLAEQALAIPYRQLATFADVDALAQTGFHRIDAVNYVSDGQRYPLTGVMLDEWNRRRLTRIRSIPEMYFFNPANTSIQVYPLPASTGTFEVWGRKVDTPMQLTDVLDPSVPAVFIQYLKYLMASVLCATYSIPFTPEKQQRLEALSSAVTNQTIIDTQADLIYAYSDSTSDYPNTLATGRGWRV